MNKSASAVIIVSFLSVIIIGALLLLLPISTTQGIRIEDALFTSASAVTVTGLGVVDTPSCFTSFGQTVILLLMQVGGLGFMTLSTFAILLMGKTFSLKDKTIIENGFTAGSYKNIEDLLRKIILFTFIIELCGALSLYLQFTRLSGPHRAFASVFHAVSAFCNAGFSVFSNSFEDYIGHWGINITIMLLIILGGIGFLVMSEVSQYTVSMVKKRRKIKLSLHTRMVLVTTGLLIFIGALIIFIEELFNPKNTLPIQTNILQSLFQSVTARTAGFNSINLNYLSASSIFILIILMFIGGSPGSCAGGIKTSSAATVYAYFRAQLRGQEQVNLFYRQIPPKTVEKAFMITIISFLTISSFIIVLLSIEWDKGMIDVIFETFSAFGTVGLSKGITFNLAMPSKLLLSLTMFIGRVGPLTIFLALSKGESRAVYRYPQEDVMIG